MSRVYRGSTHKEGGELRSKAVAFFITPSMSTSIQDLADKRGISRSELIRLALERTLTEAAA